MVFVTLSLRSTSSQDGINVALQGLLPHGSTIFACDDGRKGGHGVEADGLPEANLQGVRALGQGRCLEQLLSEDTQCRVRVVPVHRVRVTGCPPIVLAQIGHLLLAAGGHGLVVFSAV